ncbi:MAG: two-component regulator propeller domain-containing protein [Verrucomicrobiota bacterium]|jgi:PAS domain S-box-containing protein
MNQATYKMHHKPLRSLLLLGSVLLFIGGPFQASALDPNRSIYQYNCRTWRRANGLPANAVTAIAQTEDGRLWLGTSQGLVFFDGVGFRVFSLSGKEGIESKVINGLARRSGGGLWFGLERGSFGYFDGELFHSLQRDEWGGPFATVHSVLETHDRKMLLGGSGLAGNWINTNTFNSLLPTNNADVFSIYEDPHGRIWMGTAEHGLFYWENGRLTPFPDRTLRNAVISAIAVDRAGNIWVGSASGLRCYGPNFRPVPSPEFASQPKALLMDRHGVLWIGTVNSGLVRYQGGVFTSLRKQDGLASDRILSLAESDDGSLWVGTEDGLSQLSDVKFPIFSTTEGLSLEACLSVAASPSGGIWAGTPNGVSNYRDGQFANFGFNGADGFRSRWIKRVFAARNGDVYFIGARKNLDRFRDDHVVMSWTNTAWPRAVAEDSHGILVALAGDLMRIESDKLVPICLADGSTVSLRWINDLLVARDDSIWVAAAGGIFQIKDGVLHNWCEENGLYQSTFFYLCEDDNGAIWAAQNTGIARFKNGVLRQITRQQGLHEDFVYAIVSDKLGNFWMDSNRGIFRVSQRKLNAVADGTAERVHCSVYEGEDAVKTTDKSAQEYSGCRSSDGRIWFPSSKGVIMIDPANVSTNPLPPVVSIERVRINGQEYRPDQEPVLEPGPGNLEFDYSALDYQAPQKIQYRYKLDGYESDWVDAGSRRSAFYTNLKPGRYHFQVQACNADGVWNTTGTSFALELPRRFDETITFRVMCLVVALGFGVYVWWVWHLRRRHVQLQQTRALLESKVQERTSELRNEIEERIRVEETLRESEEKFHQLAENITDVFWITSPDRQKIYYVSHAYELIWGRPVAELYAHPQQWLEAILPADRERVLAVFATLMGNEPRVSIEYQIARPDGAVRWIHDRGFQVRDAAGNVVRLTGIVTDITEHKQLEAQLFHSQKMETVGKLAGGVAHEFNSILTAIIGQSELLIEALPSGGPLSQNATEISKAADRAAVLTRQLLAYGRKQFLHPKTLDLNQVIAGMEGMLRHLMGGDVNVRILSDAGLRAVKADAGQLEQVIINMAINARDAMPRGGKLTLETANVTFNHERADRDPEMKPGDYVMLAITDTGTGMSAEVKARVFEPFFSTKDVGQGTGLGLATCYGIIKQSGGHISVYSEPGRGTTFKIYLPQVQSETPVRLQLREPPGLPRGTETILLVEDDPALCEMAAEFLRRLGYVVLAAANGLSALRLVEQRGKKSIDLLFADVVMPQLNGKELSERVGALHPETRILFTSAYAENAIVHQKVLSPSVAILQKPFTPSALAHKVREVLDQ